MVKDQKTGECIRADHLLEDVMEKVHRISPTYSLKAVTSLAECMFQRTRKFRRAIAIANSVITALISRIARFM